MALTHAPQFQCITCCHTAAHACTTGMLCPPVTTTTTFTTPTWQVMPCDVIGFTLRPVGFFEANPALVSVWSVVWGYEKGIVADGGCLVCGDTQRHVHSVVLCL